jgi:hypothetical protein
MCQLPLFTLLQASFLAVSRDRLEFKPIGTKGRRGSTSVNAVLLLERVSAAAEERHLFGEVSEVLCLGPVYFSWFGSDFAKAR